MAYVKDPERLANKDQLSGYAGLDASGNGHVGTTHLGDGSANATTFLRGDSTWATPAASSIANVITKNPGNSPYAVQTSDYIILASAGIGGIILNLPDASSNSGKMYVIKKSDDTSDPVSIVAAGTDYIDTVFDASVNLTVPLDSITIVSFIDTDNFSSWHIL